MTNAQDEDRRLASILGDAAWATIWATAALFALMLVSYVIFLIMRSAMPGTIAS